MIVPLYLFLRHSGYIAGGGAGIVTASSKPVSRNVYLLDVNSLAILHRSASLKNGHYLFMNLDPAKEYMVMVRDYKKEYEPFVWDYVKPADDLTIDEQQALWASFQT